MPKAKPLLLDLYPNAAVAYSLRKLRTAYTGNAIRVRRSVDNAEQDIGFIGNDLDTASLLTFCGAGNGFVTTWYDQSTTGVNLTQITASIQPAIVRNGVLITENGKVAINDTIGTNNIGLGATFNGNANFYSFNVVKYIGDIHTMFSSQVNGSYFLVANSTDTTNPITGGVTSPSYRKNGSAITLTTRQGVATALSTYSLMRVKGNNSTWTRLGLGGRINGAGTMYKSQEYVIYYADKTADEIGIENNINAYWGIY